MFIWTAIEIENQLIFIKNKIKKAEDIIGFTESNVTLPLHISLKISFEIQNDKYDEILSDLINIYSKVKPFEINVDRIELHETICWIKMFENNILIDLHNQICNLVVEKYGVSLHEFDKCFAYHTTLFLDSDKEKVKEGFMLLKDEELPTKLVANKFVIGGSESGELGTYKVFKEIEI